MSNIGGHWMHKRDNGKFVSYLMIKGSSQYNTEEMAHFIDGVVSECKELGIDTITPTEIKQMKERWGT